MKSQSRLILAVLVIFVALSLTLMGTTEIFAQPWSVHGVLQNNRLLAYASTSGRGGNSGRIWSAHGFLEPIGLLPAAEVRAYGGPRLADIPDVLMEQHRDA